MANYYNKRCMYCGQFIKFVEKDGRYAPLEHPCPSPKNPYYDYIRNRFSNKAQPVQVKATVLAPTPPNTMKQVSEQKSTSAPEPMPAPAPKLSLKQRIKAFIKGRAEPSSYEHSVVPLTTINTIIEQRINELQKTRATIKSKATDALLIREIQTMCIKELKDLQEKLQTMKSREGELDGV